LTDKNNGIRFLFSSPFGILRIACGTAGERGKAGGNNSKKRFIIKKNGCLIEIIKICMESLITNFEFIEKTEGYDKINNPLRLSVYELLPAGIKWHYNGKEYKIKKETGLVAILLNDEKHIAVVEETLNGELNEAYIVTGNNIQKYNIRRLLNESDLTIKSPYAAEENNTVKDKNTIIFDAVYYEGQELYFFIFIKNEYYRFSFNLENGKIGKLIVSR
jgi:hypothetical protein